MFQMHEDCLAQVFAMVEQLDKELLSRKWEYF
jgi:hypothetical protein